MNSCTVVCRWLLCHSLPVVQYQTSTAYQTLVIARVLSQLDYGNTTLAGLLACLVNHLKPVHNAAAQSITGLRHSHRITDTLDGFHWL